MATLDNLFAHRRDFKPQPPESESDVCECPACEKAAPFGEWTYHNGTDSGYWCEDCNDLHSCFECPNCGEVIGAAGRFTGQIEVTR